MRRKEGLREGGGGREPGEEKEGEREGGRGREREGGKGEEKEEERKRNKPNTSVPQNVFDFLSGGRRTSTTIKVVSLMRSRTYDVDGSPRSSVSPEPPPEGQGEGRKEPPPEGMWCTASLVGSHTK